LTENNFSLIYIFFLKKEKKNSITIRVLN